MVSTCYVRSLGIILRAARVVLVKKRKTMWLVFLLKRFEGGGGQGSAIHQTSHQ